MLLYVVLMQHNACHKPATHAEARFTVVGSVCVSDCPGKISTYVCSCTPAGYGAYHLYDDMLGLKRVDLN